MSKIDKVMQWIGLVALILSVIGNFVIFGYFDSERSKRIELEAQLEQMYYWQHYERLRVDSLLAVPPKDSDWRLDIDTTITYDSSEVTE